MKVLMISTDRKIFEPKSEVRQRMIEYAGLFDELKIIVFSKKDSSGGNISLTTNCVANKTNSLSPFLYVWDAIKISQALIGDGSDWVVTCQDPFETGLVGWWLKKKLKVKLQLQVHTDLMSPYFKRESLKNLLRVNIAKFLLPRADKIRVVSERIKQSLENLKLKTGPIVLPIFVGQGEETEPQTDLHNKYPQFDFIILMASRLSREKNFSLALESFAEAGLDKIAGLVIVGEGPEKQNIKKKIKNLQIDNKVILEPWVENLTDYYKSADLFLLTSNYEGYGRTLIEAGLAGCPILTTDIGLVGDVIDKESALICSVGDKDCLVDSISVAVSNNSLLRVQSLRLKENLESKIVTQKADYLRRYKDSMV
jgi:glycosyltransferase involved in cell wall biosynthesis